MLKIKNWKDVVKHFGYESNLSHKSAKQISKILTDKVKSNKVIDKRILINYTVDDYFDGGHAIFDYVELKDGQSVYEFTGTIN